MGTLATWQLGYSLIVNIVKNNRTIDILHLVDEMELIQKFHPGIQRRKGCFRALKQPELAPRMFLAIFSVVEIIFQKRNLEILQ